jgi:hypothetical protein
VEVLKMDDSNANNLQKLIYISLIMIFIYPINTLCYLVAGIEISNFVEINKITLFFLIVNLLGFLLNRNDEINPETNEKIKLSIRPIYKLNIFIFPYAILDFSLKRKTATNPFISFIIMEAYFVFIILLTKTKLSFILQDRKLQWIKATRNVNITKDRSFTWRLKLWFAPCEKVFFKNRLPGMLNVATVIIIITYFIAYYPNSDKNDLILFIPFLFIVLRNVLMLIDCFFGFHTSLTGICTKYIYTPQSKGRDYYYVYITDFENKREIRFKCYEELNLYVGQDVKIVHGIFSKMVISVNGIILDIKS